jgi:hypothetical protein
MSVSCGFVRIKSLFIAKRLKFPIYKVDNSSGKRKNLTDSPPSIIWTPNWHESWPLK